MNDLLKPAIPPFLRPERQRDGRVREYIIRARDRSHLGAGDLSLVTLEESLKTTIRFDGDGIWTYPNGTFMVVSKTNLDGVKSGEVYFCRQVLQGRLVEGKREIYLQVSLQNESCGAKYLVDISDFSFAGRT